MIAYGGSLLVVLLICGVGENYLNYQLSEDAWRGRQGEAARNAATTVASFLQRAEDTLALAGGLDVTGTGMRSQVLSRVIERNPALQEIMVVDAAGGFVAGAAQDEPILPAVSSIPGQQWFAEARAGRTFMGDFQLSPNGEPYIVMALPAETNGAMAARLHVDVLWQVVGDIRFGETGRVYVVDRQGYVIAHTDPGVVLAHTSIQGRPETAAAAGATNNEWHGEYVNFQGIRVVGATMPVVGTDWTLFAELPVTEAYQSSRNSVALFVCGLLVFSVGMIGASRYMLRYLLFDPIDRLRDGVQRIGQGDLGFRIAIEQQDEIGQVAAAFNEMAARLHDAHTELEQRVEERTAELAWVNHDLEAEVAQREHAEQVLKQYAARLERSNNELQQFAYMASHDLQEPLRKVLAFGDRLRDRCGPALGEQGLDYLTRMQNAAARMQALIEGLLTFSRVTTKAQPFVSVNLNKVIQEVLSDLETRTADVGGKVEIGQLPAIEADPLQMRQLFQNLIGNALKFHRNDLAPVVTISASYPNGHNGDSRSNGHPVEHCQITVSDNGIGFDEKYLDRIFQVFQRLHGRGEYEGAGIGLAVCRKIVDRHGGEITANSTPGQGATFVVTLPVQQAASGERTE